MSAPAQTQTTTTKTASASAADKDVNVDPPLNVNPATGQLETKTGSTTSTTTTTNSDPSTQQPANASNPSAPASNQAAQSSQTGETKQAKAPLGVDPKTGQLFERRGDPTAPPGMNNEVVQIIPNLNQDQDQEQPAAANALSGALTTPVQENVLPGAGPTGAADKATTTSSTSQNSQQPQVQDAGPLGPEANPQPFPKVNKVSNEALPNLVQPPTTSSTDPVGSAPDSAPDANPVPPSNNTSDGSDRKI